MKKNLVLIVLLVITLVAFATGCDRVKQMLGIGTPEPVPGPIGPAPGQPTGAPPRILPPNTLSSCTITNLKAGKMQDDGSGNLYVYEETSTIPYIPSTYVGISFEYKGNSGENIAYTENEFFPYPPQNWTLWEGSEGGYQTFPEESRATYTTTLTPDADVFTSYWGFNPSGDPIGEWRWDIYFNNEYYTTVYFDVVPATR